jgi:NDP-sugar pyrophosphorylase family protein
LRTPRDLRQLVKDSFESRCRLQPAGKQHKPGVWIDEGASVHRMARLVAPAYVGRNSQVEAGALITRGSNIEAGCSVAGGTVVEDASILRNTYVGPGLEISQAVVERGRFMHLRRNVAVTIADPSLIGAIEPQSRETPFMFDTVVVPAGVRARNESYGVPGQLSEAFGD